MSKKKKKPNKPSVPTTQKLEILKLIWKDHNAGNHAWTTKDEIRHRPLMCVSVGINVKEDREGVTLAQNMGHNMDLSDTIYVLKNCIVTRTKLGDVDYGLKE